MTAEPTPAQSTHAKRPCGRFAPSPTGSLHFGSLVAALASYLHAKHASGQWLIRIEDLDTARNVPGAADSILRDLERFGFEWDGEVIYQSRRIDHYQETIRLLDDRNLVFRCRCSRKQIASLGVMGIDGPVYPGTCRNQTVPDHIRHALRLRIPAWTIEFTDEVQGRSCQRVDRDVGDLVLLRADAVFSYQLAAVIDDFGQGITQIVRGADLLDSTARQIAIQQLLGYVRPTYLHIPVAVYRRGLKLSKRLQAQAIAERPPTETLGHALQYLGQPLPEDAAKMSPKTLLQWAVLHWQPAAIPRKREVVMGASAEDCMR
ncbi:MAG: tRNA glutamyl-Q(34) synthetase GluQRS [Pseudomonadota bacterium]|nr:tRNA glutamyl-Q(34) synthetase GluQRS [Pseudomonadota bacterium]